ncbi:MAG: GNAT family N-acetyltransferase [Anaerolinea sp.]|nr:GNAT family N-acetyltransferase [Anaerolinea sp.]
MRPEKPDDRFAIGVVHIAAFGEPNEAPLVDALRPTDAAIVSLVAENAGRIIGHILFSEVTIEENPQNKMVAGLAPLAVLPDFQKEGAGSKLITEGLKACLNLKYDAAVILGSTAYYSRFGFHPASGYNLKCEYPVLPEDFMAMELIPHGLDQCKGLVKYHKLFGELEV